MIFFLATIRDNFRLENLVFVEKVGDFFQGSIRSFSFEGRKSFFGKYKKLFLLIEKIFSDRVLFGWMSQVGATNRRQKMFRLKNCFFFEESARNVS